MATERARYTISVDDEIYKRIEDFRFERRFQTRSEATAELIRLGLEYLSRRPDIPNEETKQALDDAHKGKNVISFKNTDDMFKELGI